MSFHVVWGDGVHVSVVAEEDHVEMPDAWLTLIQPGDRRFASEELKSVEDFLHSLRPDDFNWAKRSFTEESNCS